MGTDTHLGSHTTWRQNLSFRMHCWNASHLWMKNSIRAVFCIWKENFVMFSIKKTIFPRVWYLKTYGVARAHIVLRRLNWRTLPLLENIFYRNNGERYAHHFNQSKSNAHYLWLRETRFLKYLIFGKIWLYAFNQDFDTF